MQKADTGLIDVDDLTLSLNGNRILDGVRMHVETGRIYGLIGPNGAGKSTTIAVLLGLYGADSGTVTLFGEAVASSSVENRRHIGVMPEQAGFYGWMNAAYYLAWYAELYDGPGRSIAELLTAVGLATVGRRPINRFSQGMRQRLGLARALVHGPRLLILDEPTNGLDPRGRREIHDLLLTLVHEQRVAILLCTHLLDDVDRLCDRIGIIDHGRTVLEGPLDEVLSRGESGNRFRLRVRTRLRESDLAGGAKLLSYEDGWCRLRLEPGADPVGLWRHLLGKGSSITEIHAEGGGLEALYLRMTGGSANGHRQRIR